MKTPHNIPGRLKGAVMIFALLVVVAGAFVLVAWAQMLATRNLNPDAVEVGMNRRVAFANARLLARQYLLMQAPSGSIAAFETNLANDWGAFEIQFSRAFLWTKTNLVDGNPFNPFGPLSFLETSDESSENDKIYCYLGRNPSEANIPNSNSVWRYRIRSWSPLLAGYPLVVQRPASTNSPTNDNFTAAHVVLWTNATSFPLFPQVAFTGSTTTNGYAGFLDAPVSGFATNLVDVAEFTVTSRTTNGTNRYASVRLSTANTTPFLRYNLGVISTNDGTATNFATIYDYTITELAIASSANTNTLHIVAANTPAFTNLVLDGTPNTRKIYLNKSGGRLILKATNFTTGDWALGMTLSGNTTFSNALPNTTTLNIYGGIRSDGLVQPTNSSASVGEINLLPDTNALGAGFIYDRAIWIEQNRVTNN